MLQKELQAGSKELKAVEQRVRKIVESGKVAKFERPNRADNSTVTKFVNAWNPDELGDLKAYWTKNASTPYVCLWDASYTITELTQDQAIVEAVPE
jgi:hypothetical protein